MGSGYSVILLSGDLLLTTTSIGDGLTMTIDSLDPYASQTITLVTGGSSSLLSPVAYTAQIISVGSVLASCSVGDGGTFAIPFTPDATSVTLTITQTSTHSGTLDLLGIYVPRFDSFVTENVVTTVSDEDKYHYGYNGKTKDNEWAGAGNHTTAEFWEYDTRTGRRGNRDPRPNPSLSDYATFGNNPILIGDLVGDSPMIYGQAEALGRTLADKGGTQDDARNESVYKDATIVPLSILITLLELK